MSAPRSPEPDTASLTAVKPIAPNSVRPDEAGEAIEPTAENKVTPYVPPPSPAPCRISLRPTGCQARPRPLKTRLPHRPLAAGRPPSLAGTRRA